MAAEEFLGGKVLLYPGDCREVLRGFADASIDSVVTDPPYALVSIGKRFGKPGAAPAQQGRDGLYARASAGFMGQQWDTGETAFAVEFWAEVLRVLKPGGHVVAFSGTRTYHRMVCAIEDAGFEIRDQLAWIYASGFPKSHDVAKGIDKRRQEDEPRQKALGVWLRSQRNKAELSIAKVATLFPSSSSNLTGCVSNWELGLNLPSLEQWAALKSFIGFGDEFDTELEELLARRFDFGADWKAREVTGEQIDWIDRANYAMSSRDGKRRERAFSADAQRWEGWGTALKPAWEPIVLARKSPDSTVAETVLQHGTGALNIDGCRIEGRERTDYGLAGAVRTAGNVYSAPSSSADFDSSKGRWPANILHDGSDEVVSAFPTDRPGFSGGGRREGLSTSRASMSGPLGNGGNVITYGDSGSASRFFFSAKADTDDRLGFDHPTVKPVDLMQWLVRLVTPPGGVVLDPFAGTGSTGEAAFREGFRAVLVERETKYQGFIRARMALAQSGAGERKRAAGQRRAAAPVDALFGPAAEAAE